MDVVAVDRIAGLIARRPAFVPRVFSDVEVADATRGGVEASSSVAARRFAARFAAKEAARKVFGRGYAWRDVVVHTGSDGAPHLLVRGQASAASLSLSHDGGVAVAFVIAPDRTE